MRVNNLVGQRFGRLVVLRRAEVEGTVRWICKCDCGKEHTVFATALRGGFSKSCGCLRVEWGREHGSRIRLRHGEGGNGKETPEYRAWANMNSRCHNPNHQSFKHYGGRGIFVCDRWRKSYEDFLADVGRRPSSSHSIDRIDNDAGYEPGNVRWATSSEQNNNQRKIRSPRSDRRTITANGVTRTLNEWLEILGIKKAAFYGRLRSGMTEEQAVTVEPMWKNGKPRRPRIEFLPEA